MNLAHPPFVVVCAVVVSFDSATAARIMLESEPQSWSSQEQLTSSISRPAPVLSW